MTANAWRCPRQAAILLILQFLSALAGPGCYAQINSVEHAFFNCREQAFRTCGLAHMIKPSRGVDSSSSTRTGNVRDAPPGSTADDNVLVDSDNAEKTCISDCLTAPRSPECVSDNSLAELSSICNALDCKKSGHTSCGVVKDDEERFKSAAETPIDWPKACSPECAKATAEPRCNDSLGRFQKAGQYELPLVGPSSTECATWRCAQRLRESCTYVDNSAKSGEASPAIGATGADIEALHSRALCNVSCWEAFTGAECFAAKMEARFPNGESPAVKTPTRIHIAEVTRLFGPETTACQRSRPLKKDSLAGRVERANIAAATIMTSPVNPQQTGLATTHQDNKSLSDPCKGIPSFGLCIILEGLPPSESSQSATPATLVLWPASDREETDFELPHASGDNATVTMRFDVELHLENLPPGILAPQRRVRRRRILSLAQTKEEPGDKEFSAANTTVADEPTVVEPSEEWVAEFESMLQTFIVGGGATGGLVSTAQVSVERVTISKSPDYEVLRSTKLTDNATITILSVESYVTFPGGLAALWFRATTTEARLMEVFAEWKPRAVSGTSSEISQHEVSLSQNLRQSGASEHSSLRLFPVWAIVTMVCLASLFGAAGFCILYGRAVRYRSRVAPGPAETMSRANAAPAAVTLVPMAGVSFLTAFVPDLVDDTETTSDDGLPSTPSPTRSSSVCGSAEQSAMGGTKRNDSVPASLSPYPLSPVTDGQHVGNRTSNAV